MHDGSVTYSYKSWQSISTVSCKIFFSSDEKWYKLDLSRFSFHWFIVDENAEYNSLYPFLKTLCKNKGCKLL